MEYPDQIYALLQLFTCGTICKQIIVFVKYLLEEHMVCFYDY